MDNWNEYDKLVVLGSTFIQAEWVRKGPKFKYVVKHKSAKLL